MLNLKHQSDFSLLQGFSVRLYDEKKRTCVNENLCVIRHRINGREITNSPGEGAKPFNLNLVFLVVS